MNSPISENFSPRLLHLSDSGSYQIGEKQASEDADSLLCNLYEAYEDYFNTEEESTSPLETSSTSKSPHLLTAFNPLPQYPRAEKPNVSTDFSSFFVLGTTSPISPSISEAESSPISPLTSGSISEALLNTILWPSESLLEVTNITRPKSFEQEELEQGHRRSGAEPNSTKPSNSGPLLKSLTRFSDAPGNRSQSGLSLKRQSSLQFRDSDAAVPVSLALIDSSNVPASSIAEASPPFSRWRTDPIGVHDLQSRVAHRTSSPAPYYPSVLKVKVRGALSLDITRPPPQKATQFARGYNRRGLRSSSPLPIQYDFAPISVPGSATTPYSYF